MQDSVENYQLTDGTDIIKIVFDSLQTARFCMHTKQQADL
jgi:hypothetical protein